MIPWWSTKFDNGEDYAVAEAVRNKNISQGSITLEFEKKLGDYLGVPHVIAVTSGSSALLLSLMALEIEPGDEVLVPNRAWIATAHAVSILGATPVFVDTEMSLPIMSVNDAQSKITNKTKAIIPVHMNGHAVDIDGLRNLAKAKNIKIIEDSAQALGSKDLQGNYLGTLGDVGCFSLSVAKIISTGQGGFIVTKNDQLAQKLRNMRTHGVENTIEVKKWEMPGFNFRFTDVLASIGIVQIELIEERIEKLKTIQEIYLDGLQGLSQIKLLVNTLNEIGPYIEVLGDKREELAEKLKMRNIETRKFYPNLDEAPYWKSQGKSINSKIFQEKGLYLPSGPGLTKNHINYVISNLRNLL